MAEYIDLNETIIDFGFEWDDIAPTRDEFINFLKSRKRTNVKEIVYAHWIDYQVPHISCCSYCDWGINPLDKSPYCPNCGAEMSEVK